MNDINVMVVNYLNDVYHIKDTSVEGVEKAIDDIFNFENILPQYKSLFNSLMVESINFDYVSERLTFKKMMEQLDAETLLQELSQHFRFAYTRKAQAKS